jgi:hypothetical protein
VTRRLGFNASKLPTPNRLSYGKNLSNWLRYANHLSTQQLDSKLGNVGGCSRLYRMWGKFGEK